MRMSCVVTCVREKTFSADMYDVDDRSNPVESACFYLSSLEDEDLELVAEGALFVWVVTPTDSMIVFSKRRWKQHEIDDAKREAARLKRTFGAKV